MKKLNKNYISALFIFPLVTIAPFSAIGQVVVNDTLTGASSSYSWRALGDACLTAGDGRASSIPACRSYYDSKNQVGGVSGSLPDPIGQGALRLTDGGLRTSRTGAVVSTTPFDANRGIQVNYSTATYGGNSYVSSGRTGFPGSNSGADGLAFFLADGSKSPSIGSAGGSLGYSCSQNKGPGVIGGYVAVATDEYGNFSNKNDSTSDGIGPNPGAIVVRGAGSIDFDSLHQLNPFYYPNGLDTASKLQAVRQTCGTGFLQNFHYTDITDANGNTIHSRQSTTETVLDYRLLMNPVRVAGSIYNQEMTFDGSGRQTNAVVPKRGDAKIFTYALKITQTGLLSLSYSVDGGAVQPLIIDKSIKENNGPLPPTLLFGFTSGTGGGTNVHEILCFKAQPIVAASTAAATNTQQSAKVRAGSQVYLAYYHPINSWGQLTASNLVTDAGGNVSINSLANWDANCALTGGICAPTGGGSTTAQTSSSRSIIAWNGTKGIPFRYSDLDVSQKIQMGGATNGQTQVDYLRGDRSKEVFNGGSLRSRDGVLGDIVNSGPTWVGYPSSSFTAAGNDLLNNDALSEFGSSYTTFAASLSSRMNVVYAGANDGMMHGFRAGLYSNSTTFDAANNDGNEVLSYVPAAVIKTIHSGTNTLDFSSPSYAHNSYVDGTPGTGDLYYSGAWHTWLVGGLGAGGNAAGVINDTYPTEHSNVTSKGVLYALDITNPAQFTESNAANIVMGEWSSLDITCVNDANCKSHLGSVYGTPIIRRLHDGNWAVIFGNGRDSASGTAGVFIMTVDKTTGNKTFRFIDTNKTFVLGSSKNGIDFVSSADLDSDQVTDYLYAGDYKGNVWRFDLTDKSPSNWISPSAAIFKTPSSQPITTKIAVTATQQKNGTSRLILSFGTGRSNPQALTSGITYASGGQSFYGIWDWNLSAWNAKSATKYIALTSPQPFTSTDLQVQTITDYIGNSGQISGFRTVSQNSVCWKGVGSCTQFGWKVNFNSTNGEQIIYNPLLSNGSLLFNTIIPAVTQTLSCSIQNAEGFTMAIDPETGGAPVVSFFNSISTSAGFTTMTRGIISGLGIGGTGAPTIVSANGSPYLVQQTTSGIGNVTKVNPSPSILTKRLSWVKLR
jgi:type IV pilus assembly protein PilY1